MTMRVLGLIPARGGSKGIPGKNLVELGGRSLLSWTAGAALESGLTRTVISTDDEAIAAEAVRCGIEVPFIRPAHLASDEAASIDVVLHALDNVDESYEAVMLLQPTSPFREVADINGAIALLEQSVADSVVSVVEVGDAHPARMKFIEDGVLIDPPFAEEYEGQPRQTLPKLYLRNGAVYLTRVASLRQRTFKGQRSLAWVMPETRSVNIDSPLDLVVARSLAGLA
jgi:N-acylneuraminate cytidylyltransferase